MGWLKASPAIGNNQESLRFATSRFIALLHSRHALARRGAGSAAPAANSLRRDGVGQRSRGGSAWSKTPSPRAPARPAIAQADDRVPFLPVGPAHRPLLQQAQHAPAGAGLMREAMSTIAGLSSGRMRTEGKHPRDAQAAGGSRPIQASMRVYPAAPWRRNDPRDGVQLVQSVTTAMSVTPARSRSATFAARRSQAGRTVGATDDGLPAVGGDKDVRPVFRHGVAAGADPWSDDGGNFGGNGAEPRGHHREGVGGDPRPPPPRVHHAEGARAPVREKNRKTVGHGDAEHGVHVVREKTITLETRHLFGGLALDDMDPPGVDLAEGVQALPADAAPLQVARAPREGAVPGEGHVPGGRQRDARADTGGDWDGAVLPGARITQSHGPYRAHGRLCLLAQTQRLKYAMGEPGG